MSTPTLLGVAEPRGSYTARYLHYGDQPAALVPLLRRIWVNNFNRDTDAMSAGLLARDWSSLTVDPEPGRLDRDAPVPGLGRPAPSAAAAPRRGLLTETVDGFLEWLYLLHADLRVVEVYEATCHTRWLRHSLHHLHPEEELFVTEPDPRDGAVPEMTVCTACGAVDEVESHELPSMVGYGVDTCTSCRRCGSSVTTDPMFGAHVNREV